MRGPGDAQLSYERAGLGRDEDRESIAYLCNVMGRGGIERLRTVSQEHR